MNKDKILKNLTTPCKWFNIADNKVYIDNVIGASFWDDEAITPKSFMAQVKAIKTDDIELHVNSPGGSVYDGFAIYQFLCGLDKKITGIVDAMAASIASVILMAADKIIVPETSTIMIHDPWGIVIGNSSDLRKEAEELDRIQGQIADVYNARTGQPKEKINALMAAETYMTGREAFDMKFADEVSENKRLAACSFDLDIFDKLPPHFKKISDANTKRNLEESLRDAGYSIQQAKKLAAGPDNQRDADIAEIAALLKSNINILKN